jgi:hypothetical protein
MNFSVMTGLHAFYVLALLQLENHHNLALASGP